MPRLRRNGNQRNEKFVTWNCNCIIVHTQCHLLKTAFVLLKIEKAWIYADYHYNTVCGYRLSLYSEREGILIYHDITAYGYRLSLYFKREGILICHDITAYGYWLS